MKFKCNFCERIIPARLYGEPEINCFCGAKYRMRKFVEVTLEQPPKVTTNV